MKITLNTGNDSMNALFVTVNSKEANALCRSLLSQIENSSPNSGRLESSAQLDSNEFKGNVYFTVFVKDEEQEVSRIWKGKVKASRENLKEIGIEEDITEKVITVFDKDKFYGIGGSCSHIEVENVIEMLGENLVFRNVYLIPTSWIEFLSV